MQHDSLSGILQAMLQWRVLTFRHIQYMYVYIWPVPDATDVRTVNKERRDTQRSKIPTAAM